MGKSILDLPVPELAKRLSDDPLNLAIAFEEIADTCKSGHPIQVRYTVPELLLNLKVAVIRAKADSAILATYQTDLSEDPTTPSLDKGIQLLTRLNTRPERIAEWADSCRDYAVSWRELVEYRALRTIGPAEPNGKQTAKQTIEQTISAEKQTEVAQNFSKEKKPWTPLATDLKDRWFAGMTKRKRWIPRSEFFVEFLNGKEGQRDKWKGVKAGTEDKRFSDNPGQWKAEAEGLKASFKQGTANRR